MSLGYLAWYVDVGAEGAQVARLCAVLDAVLPDSTSLATAGPHPRKRSTRTCLRAGSSCEIAFVVVRGED